MAMNISWLLLTWNRAAVVEAALRHNRCAAGRAWKEMVWVDNGSAPDERERIAAAVDDAAAAASAEVTRVWYPDNRGVASGYNTALALARGSHVAITGCDMKMPENWLARMAWACDTVPRAGIVSIYPVPVAELAQCMRGEPFAHAGVRLQAGVPFGRRFLSRELHLQIGYFREFTRSLYGWEDTVWGVRAERLCTRLGLRPLVLLDACAENIHSEAPHGTFESDREYIAWKRAQVEATRPLYEAACRLRCPRFTPFESGGGE